MRQHSTCHALVLRTIDIGEADRFCILLTRERGRLGARASGVRKTGSRMSGHLLPLSLVSVELQESGSGARIVGARPLEINNAVQRDMQMFLRAQQGMEFLLKLLQDDEPVPAIFDLSAQFLTLSSGAEHSPVVPFGLRLLALLGLLPLSGYHAEFASLTAEQQVFVRRCAEEKDLVDLCDVPSTDKRLESFLYAVMEEHVTSPLKARGVAQALRG